MVKIQADTGRPSGVRLQVYVGSSKNLKDLKDGVCKSAIMFWNSLTTPTEPPFISSVDTSICTGGLNAIRKHKCFLYSPFYGRACSWAMLGESKP